MCGGHCCAQYETVKMVNHDTVHVFNCRGIHVSTTFINNYFVDTVDAYAVLDNLGLPFSVNLFEQYLAPAEGATRLRVWDGDTATGTLLVDFHPTTINYVINQTVTSTHGKLTVHLHCENDSAVAQSNSLNITWSEQMAIFNQQFDDLTVTHVTANEVDLQWTSNSSIMMVSYGDVTLPVAGNSVHLTGFEPNTEYTVNLIPFEDRAYPCCGRDITFITEPVPYVGCPDLTDLQSDYTRCFYGTFSKPYDTIGIVDHGPDYVTSRHTVHTDTTETDPRTDGLLRTVCPGTSASVRLGNSIPRGQAEAISYSLHIDTNIYALLLLHYAVVLQMPNHSLSQQPRFKLEILDDYGNVIDPICGVADFSANSSLGWNSVSEEMNLWKDWTTVGFDFTPYHGQNVKVRFTTYDCSQGAHYGYAYFSAECTLNSATTQYCGSTDENTITAPDGFNYLWYFTSPSDTISTEQTVHFSNSDAMLHCRLISKENPDCYVTLNTYAGHRWPLAIIDTLYGERVGCEGYRVYFTNRSTITTDDGDTTGEHCESAFWNFGDNYISYFYSPSHLYHASGDYNVTLVAGIANNSCRDTTHFTVHVPDFYITALKDSVVCDSALVAGHYTYTDTLGDAYRVHHEHDCDTVYTPYIRIVHAPHTDLPVDTFCYSTVYTWRGQSVGSDTITRPTTYWLTDYIPTGDICDSTVTLPLVQLPSDAASIEDEYECATHTYRLTAHTGLPGPRWSARPPDASLVGHEQDSIVFVSPDATTLYVLTTADRDTAVCPAVVGIGLGPLAFPEARIDVNPEALSYDRPEFDAYDRSRNCDRDHSHWLLLPFPDGRDTLKITTDDTRLHYRVDDVGIDSLRLLLAVSNGLCRDTAQRTLPFLRSLLWAPNAFNPAGESNNRFSLIAEGITAATLTLYDRAGRVVYTTTDIATGWDGTVHGQPCPQGVYVWFLRYQTPEHPGVTRTATGTVTLLR